MDHYNFSNISFNDNSPMLLHCPEMAFHQEGIDFTVYIPSMKGHILQSNRHRSGLKGDEVLVRITHSGLSNLNVYHQFTINQALGHSGVGIVGKVGPGVMNLNKNDKVGFGYTNVTCGTCKACLSGYQDSCPSRVSYGASIGCLASHTVRREDFLFKIPSPTDDNSAATLLCGGASLYNILSTCYVEYGNRVGILGVGRLGRLAIEFAAKMGCEVVVFSRTEEKRNVAISLGANEYCATKGYRRLHLSKPLNYLLVTSSVSPAWALYTPLLAPGAVVYPLTLEGSTTQIPAEDIILKSLRVQGRVIATKKVQVEMLEWTAREGIRPATKMFGLDAAGLEHAFWWMKQVGMVERPVLVAGVGSTEVDDCEDLESVSTVFVGVDSI